MWKAISAYSLFLGVVTGLAGLMSTALSWPLNGRQKFASTWQVLLDTSAMNPLFYENVNSPQFVLWYSIIGYALLIVLIIGALIALGMMSAAPYTDVVAVWALRALAAVIVLLPLVFIIMTTALLAGYDSGHRTNAIAAGVPMVWIGGACIAAALFLLTVKDRAAGRGGAVAGGTGPR